MSQQAIRHAQRTMRYFVRFMSALALVLVTVGAVEAASVPRKYAGIVVDAKTGKTLYASAADSLRYPASVTKVMTLYVLFEELEAGRVTLNTKMKVSKHAASAVPTKLGLKAGSTIRVEDAIKSLVTLSANDMSRVIAEHISGTESKFAQRMTRTAHALGMKRTTYRNASGLPDSGQVTTVRDQARLGVAIYQHFPKYYKYFQTRSFKYGGRTYGNHNRLLGQNGVDGIKTGYIRASGYNLLTAARSNNRHIVIAAFGFDSGASRNAKVASLLKKYDGKARSGSYYKTAMIPNPHGSTTRVASGPVFPMPRPSFRSTPSSVPLPAATIAVASVAAPVPESRPVELVPQNAVQAATFVAENRNTAPQPAPRNGIDVIGAWISQTLKLDANTGAPIPPAAIGSRAGIGGGQAIDLLTSGSVDNHAQMDVTGWVIQIGAAPSQAGAEHLLNEAAGKVSGLGDFRSYVERTEKRGQVFYRARFAGFADQTKAQAMCANLKQSSMSCLAVAG